MFCSSVLLSYPEIEKPFYLQSDASDLALGAVLFQLDRDGNLCPIIYASGTLKGAELGYYMTEKELLANQVDYGHPRLQHFNRALPW